MEAGEKEADAVPCNNAQGTVDTDLIVWPETVLRVYLRQDPLYRARVFDLVERLQHPLFVGSLDLPARGAGELNSGYLIQDEHVTGPQDPGTATEPVDMEVYHKLRLLPFGEYVPGATRLPFLARWRTTGRFMPAEAAHPITLTILQRQSGSDSEHSDRTRLATSFAPSICFEAVWPGAYNRLVRAGAEFLVNITDDGWFGDTAGPYEHLNAARLRAVETRRWLVRASNSGVSVFVNPAGDIVEALPLGAVGTIRHGVAPMHTITLYVRYGDWPVPLSILIVSWFWLVRGRNEKLTRRDPAAAELGTQ